MAVQLGILAGINSYDKTCTNEATETLGGLENSDVQFSQTTKGSRPVKNLDDWAEAEFDPVPTHFQLSPLINLLADKHLKLQTGIKLDAPRLRKWVVPMYYHYCKVMGIACTGMNIYLLTFLKNMNICSKFCDTKMLKYVWRSLKHLAIFYYNINLRVDSDTKTDILRSRPSWLTVIYGNTVILLWNIHKLYI